MAGNAIKEVVLLSPASYELEYINTGVSRNLLGNVNIKNLPEFETNVVEAGVVNDILLNVSYSDSIDRLRGGELAVKNVVFDKGIDELCFTADKISLLHLAAFANDFERGKLVIDEYGADCRVLDRFGNSLLHYAAAFASKQMVVYLIESKNADVNRRNAIGALPIHLAVRQNNQMEVVEYLIEKTSPDCIGVPDIFGDTILHYAACNVVNTSIVKYLLKVDYSFADAINERNKFGIVPLHYSAFHRNIEAIKAFLDNGDVQLDVLSNKGMSVLHFVSVSSDLSVLKIDNNDNSDGDETDYIMKDAVLRCSRVCHPNCVDIVRLLKSKGASCDALDNEGRSMLHYAVEAGNSNVITYLINNEINEIAIQSIRGDQFLLFLAVEKGDVEVVRLFIENGANINEVDSKGKNLLHCAALRGHASLITYLILGIRTEVNKLSKEGLVPLQYAAINGSLEVVELLVNYGAKCDVVDLKGDSILHFAASSGHVDVVRYLIEKKKADLSLQNKRKAVAVHCAILKGHLEVVKLLIDKCDKCNNEMDRQKQKCKKCKEEIGWQKKCSHCNLMGKQHKCAKCYSVDIEGNSPLHVAFQEKYVDIALYLIMNTTCDLYKRNTAGKTPLDIAASQSWPDLIKVLIKNGGEITCKTGDKFGLSNLLHSAVENGNLDSVKYILKRKGDLIGEKKFGLTLLHVAVSRGYFKIVKFLVEKGADCNFVDNCGDTPLHYAAKRKKPDILEYFLTKQKENIDVNKLPNKAKRTPLHVAAREGYLASVELICDKGGDLKLVDAVDTEGSSALHLAALHNHLTVVEYLLSEQNADIHLRNKEGKGPLHLAISKKHAEAARLLVEKGADINALDKDDNSPLHIAARTGDVNTVRLLVSKLSRQNNSLNKPNKAGNIPFHFACKAGNLNNVQILIEEGADFEAVNKHGSSMLHIAAAKGFLRIVKYLIDEKNVSVSSCNKLGQTPIHMAAFQSNLEVLNALKRREGADFGKTDNKGNTFLHLAACCRNGFLLEHLINDINVIDINHANNAGNTPIHVAARNGHISVVEMLIEHKNTDLKRTALNGDTILHAATLSGNRKLVKYLTEKIIDFDLFALNKRRENILHKVAETGNIGVLMELLFDDQIKIATEDINKSNNEGLTPLHIAVKKGTGSFVKKLIRTRGNNLSAVDHQGRTILHFAVQSGKEDFVRYVVALKRSFINKPDNLGRTPLMVAVINGERKVAKALIESGANCNTPDSFGRTALMYAVKYGSYSLAKYLVSESTNATLNMDDNAGATALHYAAEYRRFNILKLLVESNADPGRTDRKGRTALLLAAKSSFNVNIRKYQSEEENISVLDASSDVDGLTDERRTADLPAAFNIKAINYLLDKNVDVVNKSDVDGRTCLHYAARNGLLNVVILLLAKNANRDCEDVQKRRPIDLAANEGFADVVLYLMEKQSLGDINDVVVCGLSAVLWAASFGHLNVLTTLINNGANVNVVDGEENALIHFAAIGGHCDLLPVLIGINPQCIHLENKNGETPLLCAVKNGRFEFARRLILRDFGVSEGTADDAVDLDKRDIDGKCSLHWTAFHGWTDGVKCLIEKGANPQIVDNNQFGLLHFACQSDKLDTLKYVTQLVGININSSDKNGRTPLMVAADLGLKNATEFLIDTGADAHMVDSKGCTALHLASKRGHTNIVSLLLKGGAVNNADFVVENTNWTALHFAANANHFKTVEYLLKRGKSCPNNGDRVGRTPLHLVAENGHLTVLKMLIEDRAKLSLKTKEGLTAAHLGARNGHMEIVRHLVHNEGTEVDEPCARGRTSLHFAAEKGHLSVAKVLVDLGADLNKRDSMKATPLHKAAENGHHDVVEFLLGKGADMNAKNLLGITPLYFAAGKNWATVELLLKVGAECSITDNDGSTPAHFAAKNGNLKIIDLLDSFKAEIDRPDNNNATPLHWAAANGHLHVVRSLHRKGALIDKRDKQGYTPLHWAAAAGEEYIVRYLLEKGSADYNALDQGVYTSIGGLFRLLCGHWLKCFLRSDVTKRGKFKIVR